MKIVFKTLFGSHLYGTNIEDSDHDYKGVGMPKGRDIVLGCAPTTMQTKTNTSDFKKNTKEDIDLEVFSLYKFLELAKQGQTIFYDMYFSPKHLWLNSSPVWEELQQNKDKLLHKKCGAALGYARAQAEKYSARGERLVALEEVIKFLNIYKIYPRLELREIFKDGTESVIKHFVSPASMQYIKFPFEKADVDTGKLQYLEVCGKQAGFTASVKFALEIYTRILNQYGDRAKAASLDGVDWKAMYHALRISKQTEELLLTGYVTFPRPEKDLLLKIRNGLLTYEEVSDMIEEGLQKVVAAQAVSTLPEKANDKFIEDFIYEHYLRRILNNG